MEMLLPTSSKPQAKMKTVAISKAPLSPKYLISKIILVGWRNVAAEVVRLKIW